MSSVPFDQAHRCILHWRGEVVGEARLKARPEVDQIITVGDYKFKVWDVSRMDEGGQKDWDVDVAMWSV